MILGRHPVHKIKFADLVILVLALATFVAGQGFKAYPGAKKLPPATADAAPGSTAAGAEINSYLTDDSFEKVVAFYKGLGKESSLPFMKKSQKLPNGQEITRTWFIFDGAADIMTSKSWAMIQRPYIGPIGTKGTDQDIHDVTAIVVTQAITKK